MVFKEVGDFCGGWIQTEEETKLKNHLKWARLKVKMDERAASKVVKVKLEEIQYEVQVWCEALVETP